MRPGATLRQALDDPPTAARLTSAASDLATWMEAQPGLVRLRAAVETSRTDSSAIERGLRPLLVDCGWVSGLLAGLGENVRREPLLELPFVATAGGLEQAIALASSQAATISLVLRRPGVDGAAVRVGGRLVLHRVVSGRIAAQRWTGDPIDADFSTAAAPRLRRGRWRAVASGATLRVDGRQDAVRLRADRPAVLLRLTVHAGAAPFARSYDAAGELVGASATDDGASRLAMLATMLAAMRRADAAPAIARLLEAEDFSLRWLAARLLVDLDAAAGRAALLRLAGDPHPEVRAAALAALAPDRLAA